MKSITRKEIEKSVKRAYKDVAEAVRRCRGSYYQLMMDVSDAKIWGDFFVSENSWSVYHDSDIVYLSYNLNGDILSGYIEDAIQKLQEAGWEII